MPDAPIIATMMSCVLRARRERNEGQSAVGGEDGFA
jgi:hypothetical protein